MLPPNVRAPVRTEDLRGKVEDAGQHLVYCRMPCQHLVPGHGWRPPARALTDAAVLAASALG